MRILVLGGAGYIGSHTALELVRAGEDVIVADNLVTGHREAIPAGAKFYQGDLHDFAFLDNLFQQEQIDAVIHFAAYSLVGESVTNPLKYYDNNLCGTRVLLEAMVKNHVDKIVFSSTAATYGEPEHIPILETDRTLPTNPYGETKLAMEKMFHWTANAHGLRYVSLRYFNACGADASGTIGEAHNPESHLIPLILQVPNGKREAISIYGTDYDTPDGTCHSGLYPCDRSGTGTHSGSAISAKRRGKQHFQSGQRRRLFCAGSDRNCPQGDRAPDSRSGNPAACRRSCTAGGFQRKGKGCVGLGTGT